MIENEVRHEHGSCVVWSGITQLTVECRKQRVRLVEGGETKVSIAAYVRTNHCARRYLGEATGSPTCVPTSLATTYSSCETYLKCTQPATVDGRPLTAVGRLLVHCRQTAFDQRWMCSCASDQQSAVFEYGAPEETSWDVCTAAPAQCLEHLSIHVGPYGEFVPPVDPIYGFGVQ